MRGYPKTIWSTQEQSLLGKIQIEGQSAGNQTLLIHNGVGSSETTRGTLNDIDFKYWFIGFTEGDGSFIINKTGSLEFKITQPSADAQILFYIKKKLRFGSVSVQDKNNKTHHFRVKNRKHLLVLIYIFNGNLYTKKKKIQFKLWVEAFNKIYNTNISFFQSNIRPTLDDAWLSGFTDAEGCFTVSIIKRSKNYTQVQVRYILSQQGELILLSKIALMLDGKLFYLKSYNGHNMTVNLSKLFLVISYFKTYPLKTKKRIDYLNWIKVYKLVINKKHFTEDGLNRIKNLVKKINKRF